MLLKPMGMGVLHVLNHWLQKGTGDFVVLKSRDFGRAVAVRRWTTTAMECYKRGCNCEGCFYTDFFNRSSQKCQMKASVLELVRVLGKPDIEMQQVITE